MLPTNRIPAPSANGTNGKAKPSTPKEGRDQSGRFAPGNAGGPGNPYARRVAELKKVFMELGTPEAILAIGKKMFDLAREGNVQAAKFCYSYWLGKPAANVNPDQIDLDEMQRLQETAGFLQAAAPIQQAPEPWLPLELMRVGREVTTRRMAKQTGGMVSLTPDQVKKVMELPPEKRQAKLFAAADKAYRELDRHGHLRAFAKDAQRDPHCQSGQISVAAPSPNGNKR
jgi:hypothetical protein